MKGIFSRVSLRIASLLLPAILFVLPRVAEASHYMGVDITYQCLGVSGCQYRIYHKTYYDCGGAATTIPVVPPASMGCGNTLTFTASPAGCPQPTIIGGGWVDVSYQEVTPICPSYVTKCQPGGNGAAINGVAEQTCYIDYNFCNAGAGCSYTISWETCCRNAGITSGAQQEGISSPNTVIKPGNSTSCNNSPYFLQPPVPYVCVGQEFTFNQGAFDPDGDALSYSLGTCYQSGTTSVTYNTAGGYSPSTPLGPTWDVQIDTLTGDVTVTPNITGSAVIAVFCIVITERDPNTGAIKGTVSRDIQMTVIACGTTPPVVGPIGTTAAFSTTPPAQPVYNAIAIGGIPIKPLSARAVRTCVGIPICFEIPVIDTIIAPTPTNPIKDYKMYWNGGTPPVGPKLIPYNFPSGATFTAANDPTIIDTVSGTRPVGKFCWTPQKNGVYVFQITVKDNSCPILRILNFSIILYVDDVLKNTKIFFNPTNCNLVQLEVDPVYNFTGAPKNTLHYLWQGTGNLDTLYNPDCIKDSLSHYYPAPGQYQYTVTVQDTYGCAKTFSQIGLVPTGAVADAGSDVTICAGYDFTLGGPMPPNQTFDWSPPTFLSSGSVANPTLSNPPTNSVKQTIDYTLHVTDPVTLCETYDYTRANINPNVVASVSAAVPNICAGDSVLLTCNVTNSTGNTTYLWSANTGTATTKTVWVKPTATTTYSAIAFENGCASAQATRTITVSTGPSATISGNYSVCSGSNASLTATGPFGTQFTWGGAITGSTKTVTLNNVIAPQMVTLTPANAVGCQGPPVSVTVVPYPKPTVSFTNDVVCAGVSTAFTDGTTIGAPSLVVAWNWAFGDGEAEKMQSPKHTYAAPGNYTATLTAISDQGCSNSATKSIAVKSVPNVDFTASDVCLGVQTQFTSNATLQVVTAGDALTGLSWDFGEADQPLGSGASVKRKYAAFGNYTVRLTASSNSGCSAFKEKTVFVHPLPVPNFSYISACEDSLVAFSPQLSSVPGGQDYIKDFQWDFTPGISTPVSSADFKPQVAYNAFGVYNATLTTTTQFGCKADTVMPVLVYATPTADFNWIRPCENENTQFASISTAPLQTPVAKYSWDVLANDKWVKGTNTILHNYAQDGGPGTYKVRLLVETTVGCIDTVEKDVVINPAPKIGSNRPDHCFGDTAFFEDLTTLFRNGVDGKQGLYDWLWDFRDGTTSKLPSPPHLFPTAKTYTVALTVWSDSSCYNTLNQTVTVYPAPANPAITEDTACFGQLALLSAVPAAGDKTQWFYRLKDNAPFQIGTSLIHEAAVAKTIYYVQTKTSYGCLSPRLPIVASLFPDASPVIVPTKEVVEMPSSIVGLSVAAAVPMERYLWEFGDGSPISKLPNPAHEYAAEGIFPISVALTDSNGCEYAPTLSIEVRKSINATPPTAFSPNGDGHNDVYSLSSFNIPRINFRVFDRWGVTVFESTNPSFIWDGSLSKGGIVPEGVYPYVLDTTDFEGNQKRLTGTITVIR